MAMQGNWAMDALAAQGGLGHSLQGQDVDGEPAVGQSLPRFGVRVSLVQLVMPPNSELNTCIVREFHINWTDLKPL